MKLPGLLLMTVLLQVSLSGGAQTVNLYGKDVPLTEIFSRIKTQTGVLFFYDASLLRDAKPVSIDLRQVSLETALKEIFKNQLLTWELEGKTITVIRKPEKAIIEDPVVVKPPALIRVRGIITDSEGKLLPHVSVIIKGTKQGTISDTAGSFSIRANLKNVLVFSTVNYSNKEVIVERGDMNIQLQLDVKPMELYLVGGNLNAIKRKSDATSVTVLDSKTLSKIPSNTLDQIFRGWVPGTNSFNIGDEPEGFPNLSIRGANGPTSLSPIAIYIDGIEYAGGSMYLFQLDKNNIDRVEIVRGPGAATMYGTGSNGGIVQIFTKKAKANQSSVALTTSAGFYKSKWVKNDPFQQMHSLETTTGFKNVAFKFGGSYRTVDAYLPEGGEKNKGFYAGARFNIGKFHANITGRYNVRNYHLSRSPLFDTTLHPRNDIIIEPVPGVRTPAYVWFGVRPSTSRNKDGITETNIHGINLSHRTTGNWINYLDAGYTINSTRDVPVQDRQIPLQRQYYAERYNVVTLRYSNVLTLQQYSNGFAAVFSSGAEYKKYSYFRSFTRATAANSLYLKEPDNENYGAFVQFNPSYKNVYLTLGMRYEKNNLFNAAWNPRIGLTTNFDAGWLTIKPRISWGKGITSPSYEERFGRLPAGPTVIYANSEIRPQSQQGFDFGIEVYDRHDKFKLEAVYYSNILKDMIGQASLGQIPGDSMLFAFIYTNVCKVANNGWEFSGEYQVKRFNLQATVSIMNTIIKDSTGSHILPQLKLAPGERMVNLPKHTAGLNITFNYFKLFGKADKGSVSLNITEFDGLRTRDSWKYSLDVAYGRTPYVPGVFSYPVENSRPVVRVGLVADYYIVSDLRFFIQAANILNDYTYEYNSNYATYGATWLFGLNYNFSKKQ